MRCYLGIIFIFDLQKPLLMYYQKIVFSILSLAFCLTSLAQKSEKQTNFQYEYLRGLELYNKEIYQAAYTSFEKTLKNIDNNDNLKEDCTYYLAITSVKLNKRWAENSLIDFTNNYPTSKYKNTAFLEAGNYYYNSGKPAKSLKWFQKASPKHMTSKQEEAYNFKMGYALFSNKKYTEAKQYFLALTHSEKYQEEANYYYGYICYIQEDYTTALQYFDRLEDSKRYKKEVLYYTMNIEFQKKHFEQVVTLGHELLKITSKKELSEISKIIGESYFYLGQYKASVPHLKNYKGRKNRLSTKDHYFLGYAYYKMKDYDNAIVTFNRITKGKDVVAQNAYYHLGDCYLKSDKKSEALNAFKNSSEMDFDQEIKEDAAYQYAKLGYDIGNPYVSSAVVLQEFVVNYPNSSKAIEINKLVIDSYILSKDYKGALSYYEIRHLSKDAVFYRISLFRGMQLFQHGKYQEALPYFKTTSNQFIEATSQAKALYWKGETDYILQDYKSALSNFKRFQKHKKAASVAENTEINYVIGYTYFKLKEYDKARNSFETYVKRKGVDTVKRNDSYVRMGDCSFIAKSYWTAMEHYNKVIKVKGIDDDYAQYQKGISYGFVRRNDRKISTLDGFDKTHPTSSYKDDALYELGNAYINAKQNKNALESFDKLINTYKTSVYVPKALLKQGLIYFNDNKAESAITKYKYIVQQYPKSKEAQQAVRNARQVYVDIDKVDAYAEWIHSINYTQFSDTDLDNAMYEAAEIKYQENKLPQAISSFKKYLINFPEGLHSLKAHFYSAQANFSEQNIDKSIENYQIVISQNANEFTEQSLARLGQIHLENNDWEKATPILKRLETEANFPQNILFAQSNLMKVMYEQQVYKEAVLYAEKVLAHKKADDQVRSDASIYIARAAIKTEDLDKAKKAYAGVSKLATGALKAEALYYDAYFKTIEKEYEASNKTIQRLASEYANHKYWGVKGLLLMAKNNDGLNDAFQATYILENIIQNYSQFDDLIEEAKTYLELLQKKQATKNTEVQNKETSNESSTEETTEF